MRERRHLELVAVWLAGTEAMLDGLPPARGAHLRWGFARELGFPAGGFSVYRERRPSPPVRIARIHSPSSAADYVRRLTQGHPAGTALEARYAPGADAVIEILRLLREAGPGAELAGTDSAATLRASDTVSLAALDPHVARGLGYATVDADGSPQGADGYHVVGHWSAPAWPLIPVDLATLRPVASAEWESGDLRLIARSRSLALDEDDSGVFVASDGDADSSLRLVLPFAVRELRLSTDEPAEPERWTALADSAAARATRDEATASVVFRAPGGAAFERLELRGPADRAWRLRGLALREQLGPLAELTSSTVRGLIRAAPPAPHVVALRHVGGPATIDQRHRDAPSGRPGRVGRRHDRAT